MRHRKSGYKLNRDTEHRLAMWRNMATALFTHGQITTTLPKAKSLQPFVEKLITAARAGDLAARRRVLKQLGDPYMVKGEDDPAVNRNRYGELTDAPRVVKHLFDEIAPRYADRDGGYTRIIKLARHRLGDGGDLCVLQLVGEEEEGPQVSGSYSRRRDKADRRMAFAAELRRKRAEGEAAAPEQEDEGAVATATAEDEAPADEPEATTEEASADEPDVEEDGDEAKKD